MKENKKAKKRMNKKKGEGIEESEGRSLRGGTER